MKPRVSIIVPIYNVENYLKQCLDSLVNQTYDNIEVILVNDGSPDKSAEIAKDYDEKFAGFHLYHKPNGGLSDARNFGMTFATGDYIMFVDSDDWLSEKMVATLFFHMNKHEADAVQSAFYYAYDDYSLYDNRNYSPEDDVTPLNNKSLMYELVKNEKVKNFAWGKLYKRELIKDLPFKKGVLFEDVFWAHHVMKQVHRYVICHEPLYYYRQRNDSIVSNYSIKNLDIIKGLKERHAFIEDHYNELVGESYTLLLKTQLQHHQILVMSKHHRKKKKERNDIIMSIKNDYSHYKKAVRKDKQLYRELQLFKIHPIFQLGYLAVHKGLRILNNKFHIQKVDVS